MHESLPARLRVLRARRGLHLTTASRLLGIGRDTLAALERGQRRPTYPTLMKIAEGYGIDVEELLEPEVSPAGKDDASSAESTVDEALNLSDEEFAEWIEEAKLPELHLLFSRRAGEAAVADPDERLRLAHRKQAAIDEFFRRVPIEEITVYESMLPKERGRHVGEAS